MSFSTLRQSETVYITNLLAEINVVLTRVFTKPAQKSIHWIYHNDKLNKRVTWVFEESNPLIMFTTDVTDKLLFDIFRMLFIYFHSNNRYLINFTENYPNIDKRGISVDVVNILDILFEQFREISDLSNVKATFRNSKQNYGHDAAAFSYIGFENNVDSDDDNDSSVEDGSNGVDCSRSEPELVAEVDLSGTEPVWSLFRGQSVGAPLITLPSKTEATELTDLSPADLERNDENLSISLDSSSVWTAAMPIVEKLTTCDFPILKLWVNPEFPDLVRWYQTQVVNHNISVVNDLYNANSGFDLCFPVNTTISAGATMLLNMQVKAVMTYHDNPSAFYLYPRSSIYKTSLMLGNTTGIIDSGYRNYIHASFRDLKTGFDIVEFDRLVQICHPSLLPILVEFVESPDEFTETTRGLGGLGSTGK
jgi:dUTPase